MAPRLARALPAASRRVAACTTLYGCRASFHSRALRASLRSCGLQRCGQHYCTAPRRPTMPVPRVQFVNIACFPDSLPATLRCLATRRGPTSFARRQRRRRARDALSLPIAVPHRAVRAHLAPAVRLATMRPALLRRAASSNDASAVYPVRKTLSRFAARRAESRAPRSGHAA